MNANNNVSVISDYGAVAKSTATPLSTLPASYGLSATAAFIDYHQLQIENKQAHARLAERNVELLRLKRVVGAVSIALADQNSRLALAGKYAYQLRGSVHDRVAAAAKMSSETERIQHLLANETSRSAHLASVSAADGPHMPTTIDYIALVSMEAELRAEAEVAQRRLEITALASANIRARARMLHSKTQAEHEPRTATRSTTAVRETRTLSQACINFATDSLSSSMLSVGRQRPERYKNNTDASVMGTPRRGLPCTAGYGTRTRKSCHANVPCDTMLCIRPL